MLYPIKKQWSTSNSCFICLGALDRLNTPFSKLLMKIVKIFIFLHCVSVSVNEVEALHVLYRRLSSSVVGEGLINKVCDYSLVLFSYFISESHIVYKGSYYCSFLLHIFSILKETFSSSKFVNTFMGSKSWPIWSNIILHGI